MVDIFKEARERLSMTDVARHYGYEPNRAGFICCPFHGERTPSLKLYSDHWRCFGCNRGGSTIDFAALVLGCTPLEAVKQLNADFALGLPIDRQQTPAERREAEQAAQRRREVADTYHAFEQWRTETINKLNDCFRLAHLSMKAIETPTDLDRLTDAQIVAIREQAYTEHLSDILTGGTMAEQMQIFRERRRIRQLCDERILSRTLQKSSVA